MTTTKKPWKAPTLTHYGKLSELTQAGSLLFSKDITGDGVPELFYDFSVNGQYSPVRTVEVSGGGGTLTISNAGGGGNGTFSYDTNSDGQTDLQITHQVTDVGFPNPPMLGAVLDVTVPNNTTAQNLWDLRDGVDNIP